MPFSTRKKIILAFIALALTTGFQDPDSAKDVKFSEWNPALRQVENDTAGLKSYIAIWRGQLTLTGKLVIEFDRDPEATEMGDAEGSAFFEPDDASRAKLPAATSFYPMPVTSIWLYESPRELLEPLVGKRGFQKISSGKMPRYEYPAEVRIKEFSTSVECDHRSYFIEITTIKLLQPKWSAHIEAKNSMC